jgi:hypothetical protein
MPRIRYQANGQVVIGAAGTGTVTIPGPKPGQRIELDQATCVVTGSQRMSTFTYYKGAVNDFNLISGSATGNRDTDSNPSTLLFPGDYITAFWSGADVNALASIYIQGWLFYGGDQ